MKRQFARLMGLIAAHLLTPSGLEHDDVRARLWRRGIAAQPKGFYASLEDPRSLPEQSSSPPPSCGVNMNDAMQLGYLKECFPRFRHEYAELPVDKPPGWPEHPTFFLGNDSFQNLDPLVYWAMIRLYRPQRIVEIGSGHSTLLAAQAVQRNARGHVTAIDPFPRTFIRRNDFDVELICARLQDVGHDLFTSLRTNDIVFVDSSHVVRVDGDVNSFFFDVLPQLSDGVLVHIHDIHFPFDYPRDLIESRNVYWTEQYLLQAYLLKNTFDEVLFSSRYCAHFFPEETNRAFPTAPELDGGSFWLRVHDAAPERVSEGWPARQDA